MVSFACTTPGTPADAPAARRRANKRPRFLRRPPRGTAGVANGAGSCFAAVAGVAVLFVSLLLMRHTDQLPMRSEWREESGHPERVRTYDATNTGNRTTSRAPPPGASAMEIVPSCASMRLRATARPKPAPPV